MDKKLPIVIVSAALLIVAAFLIFQGVRSEKPRPENVMSVTVNDEGVLFDRAKKATGEGDLLKAKAIYQGLIEKFPGSSRIAAAQEVLEGINIKLLFSNIPTSDSETYEVQKGDTVNKIARKMGTTPEMIIRSNGLTGPAIQAGQSMKISRAKFSIVIDKSQNILTLRSGQDIVKTYRVSTGKNSCTPVGTFKIINKIVDPPWYPSTGGMMASGDPKNVLGSRWLGISKQGYGIHGTIQPESIGTSVTEGCVRMKNSDVEELYNIVPEGTEVVITE